MRMMLRAFPGACSGVIFGLALLLAAAAGGCNRSTTDKDIETVSVAEVRRLLMEAETQRKDDLIVLVDPRPVQDFQAAHIPGARNVLLSNLPPGGRVDRGLSRFDRIVVYGEDPGSATARGMTKRLLGNGYDGVRWMSGGLREWTDLGGEVAGTAATPLPSTPRG